MCSLARTPAASLWTILTTIRSSWPPGIIRGTVEAVVVLSGGVRVKRRVFLSLTGPALTAPAHQWLIHEPEPLMSGLSGVGSRSTDQLR
ncbi:MAG: hypothetical protein ACRDSZ_16340 [Pseudonocardiaceae bacterium]